MRLNGTEIFTVSDGASPPCRKRLVDMTQFEALCAANQCQRNGHGDMAAASSRLPLQLPLLRQVVTVKYLNFQERLPQLPQLPLFKI